GAVLKNFDTLDHRCRNDRDVLEPGCGYAQTLTVDQDESALGIETAQVDKRSTGILTSRKWRRPGQCRGSRRRYVLQDVGDVLKTLVLHVLPGDHENRSRRIKIANTDSTAGDRDLLDRRFLRMGGGKNAHASRRNRDEQRKPHRHCQFTSCFHFKPPLLLQKPHNASKLCVLE